MNTDTIIIRQRRCQPQPLRRTSEGKALLTRDDNSDNHNNNIESNIKSNTSSSNIESNIINSNIQMSSYIEDTGDNPEAPIIGPDHDADLDAALSPNNTTDTTADNAATATESYWCSYKFVELLLCFIPVPIGVGLEFGTPHERPIPYQSLESINEVVLSFIYDNREPSRETFSSPVMFVCAILIPFVVQLLLILLKKSNNNNNNNKKADEVHKTFCVYFMAIGLTQTLTNFSKLYAGYLRPIFYDLCQPDSDYSECTDEHGGQQGRMSFPSGHASLSVCGLLLLSLYLERSYGVTSYEIMMKRENNNGNSNNNGSVNSHGFIRVLSVVCYAPMLLAIYIAVSRVHDNFHHPADVIGGALLGGSIASLIFGIWFR